MGKPRFILTSHRSDERLLCITHRRDEMTEIRSEIMQGTLDLMVLQTLNAMGPMHGYGIARRIEQLSENALVVNQGTIYLCLIRLVQRKWIKATWGTSKTVSCTDLTLAMSALV